MRYFLSQKVRPLLADGLRDLGWVVEEVVAYRNVQPVMDENENPKHSCLMPLFLLLLQLVNRYTQLVRNQRQRRLTLDQLLLKPEKNGCKNICKENIKLEGLM